MTRIVLLFFLGFLTLDVKGQQIHSGRQKKQLLSLFNVVTFNNAECKAATGDIGTCFTSTECSNKNGNADGNCASGFGVCCRFSTSTCGSTIRENCTYITNPAFPSAYTAQDACAFTVNPMSVNICQLRLDFDTFDIVEAATGACTDSFTVSVGSGRVYPVLCGTLTGQHIYLETGSVTSAQTLTFDTQTANTAKTWKVKVSQIECSMKAPSDCFQYYTGVSGNVQSFNFNGGTQTPLQNMIYTACIRREVGYCGIYWSVSPASGTNDAFDLSTIAAAIEGTVSGTTASGTNPAHVAIPGSMLVEYSGNVFGNVVAGPQLFSAAVLANSQRFLLEVYTDAATQAGLTGFDLSWKQAPCSSSGEL